MENTLQSFEKTSKCKLKSIEHKLKINWKQMEIN